MFKILILQRFYDLSDREMDDALSDRISFRIFVGFSFKYATPNYTTICKFRNLLIRHKLDKKLFDIFNNQINNAGLIVKKGVIVDASIVSSSRNPFKPSRDSEAEYFKKNDQLYHGYQINMSTSSENDMILSGHIAPANKHEVREFKKVVNSANPSKGAKIYGDRGLPSKENSKFFSEKVSKIKLCKEVI